MTGIMDNQDDITGWTLSRRGVALTRALGAAGPPLLFGLRLWASVCLSLYIAFWLELDNPFWAGTSAAIVCQPQLGASLRKGWFRMIGTLVGAVMSVVLTAGFAQERGLFLGGLALWGAACAIVATLLRNFASYAAALAGYTAAIITGDLLGAVGGVDADAAFLLAVTRASEICLGIVCAGVVLAGTDLGGARRRLAKLLAGLTAEIVAGFAGTLAIAASALSDAQQLRRELLSRVIALEPIIDQTLGESPQIHYHSPVLQRAVDGFFAALTGWRAVANHLVRLPGNQAPQEAAIVLENVPEGLRSAQDAEARGLVEPAALHRTCRKAARVLASLPAGTPSLRLLADKTAEAFTGLGEALNGLALLVADPARPAPRRGSLHLRVPDWLPAHVNAGRAVVTIGVVALFWIVTGWPGGSAAITFATIVALLLAPRADQAYGTAIIFTVGILVDLVLTATVAFAVLPAVGTESFAAFSLVIGLCLVPIGALLAQARQPWQIGLFTAMTMIFVPLLQPTNPMSFDPLVFYNSALAIVPSASFAALSFRLMPPLSPAFRTRRLLSLTLRDLRRMGTGRTHSDWAGLVSSRLSAMPVQATLLERGQLLAALAAGSEIVQLRHIGRRLDVGAALDAALASVAQGDSAGATVHLTRLDASLATRDDAHPMMQTILRARGRILALSEALTQHATYFDARAPR
jgi:uncharacterized membrane protein YccC